MSHFIDPATGQPAVHELDLSIVTQQTYDSDFINYGTESGWTLNLNGTWSSMIRKDVQRSWFDYMQANFTDGNFTVLKYQDAKAELITAALDGRLSLYEAANILREWTSANNLPTNATIEDAMFVLSSPGGPQQFPEWGQNTGDTFINPDGSTGTAGQTSPVNTSPFLPGETTFPEGVPEGSTFDAKTGIWTAPDGTQYVDDEGTGIFSPIDPAGGGTDTDGVEIPDGMEPIVNPDTLEVVGYRDPATGQEFNLDGTPINPPGSTPPSDIPGEDTFLDNAQGTIDRQVALENQTRDPFRDAILQFFPDLNLPGQQTIAGTRPFFDSGFALQGGGDQQQVFETITEFLRQGGDPITAQEAMRRLGELHPEFQAFQTDPTAFLDQFSPENQAAKLQTFGDLFISEGTEGLLGARDARFDAVFDPLQAQTSKFVSPALTSAIDFWRNLFNSQRGDPNDDFFIDFLAKSGTGSEFLSGFQQPSGVDFFGTGGL